MPKSDWLDLNGQAIQRILFAHRDDGVCPYIEIGDMCEALTLRAEYMGDRTEVWVSEFRAGKEFARHNTRAIESIVWATPPLTGM